MSRARRMKEKEKKDMPKLFKYFLILFFLIVIVFSILFYLIKTNKIAFLSGFFDNLKFSNATKSTASEELQDTTITKGKTIKGLDKVKVRNIDINSSETFSIITISLENTTNKKIKSKKCRMNLFDENNNNIFTSSIKMPEIDAKSTKDFKVICSDSIKNIYDYTIELEKSK